MTYLSHLECARCAKTYDADQVVNLCECGGPLLVRYDLSAVAASGFRPAALAGRVSNLWRYREVLPVRRDENIVTLGEGMTPLLPLRRLGAALGLPNLLLKDEGVNPTGTFKARGAPLPASAGRRSWGSVRWRCRRTATPAAPGPVTGPGPASPSRW